MRRMAGNLRGGHPGQSRGSPPLPSGMGGESGTYGAVAPATPSSPPTARRPPQVGGRNRRKQRPAGRPASPAPRRPSAEPQPAV